MPDLRKRRYVHGYSVRESERLADQANTLSELLHDGTAYPEGSRVLEAGCGVGAQTVILAKNSPSAQITSVDLSADSLDAAQENVRKARIRNVVFRQADIYDLPFEDGSFDHVFVCFVLEHLSDPLKALMGLKRVLRKGGSVTVIEGDHGSAYFYPESREAMEAIRCLVEVQARMGGNSLVGRRLHPLLAEAGFRGVHVSPRMVYVDSSKPELVEGFTKNTFTAMVAGVKEQVLSMNLMERPVWEKGISDLYRTTEEDGVFCYTFFKATALK